LSKWKEERSRPGRLGGGKTGDLGSDRERCRLITALLANMTSKQNEISRERKTGVGFKSIGGRKKKVMRRRKSGREESGPFLK